MTRVHASEYTGFQESTNSTNSKVFRRAHGMIKVHASKCEIMKGNARFKVHFVSKLAQPSIISYFAEQIQNR